jgi:hypothetical protein
MVYLDGYLKARNDRLLKGRRKSSNQIIKGEKRRHVIDEVIDVLKDWRLSKFENEAPIRHGLRAALCLDGHRWSLADIEADMVIQEGLNTIGAKRPSWDEGQWHYTVSPDQCVWCQGPIDAEDEARGFRFCSAVCAKSADEHRAYRTKRAFDSAAKNAYVIIKTDEAPLIACHHCAKPFKRKGAQYDSNLTLGRFKFCSVRCADKSRRVYADRACAVCEKTFRPQKERQFCCSAACAHKQKVKPANRQCLCCGTSFRSYRLDSKPSANVFCSKPCADRYGRRATIPRECLWCGTDYRAKSSKSRCCSAACTNKVVKFHNGTWKPKVLSAPLLDLVCREAGIRVTASSMVIYLTAEVFDGWFKRAA